MVKRKNYSVGGKISQTNLKKILNGKKATLKNDGEHDVIFHFKKLKDYNKHVRNMTNGKGNRVGVEHLDDITDHEGGSFFSSISRAFKNPVVKSIGKTVAKVALPMAGTAAGTMVGNPALGMAAGKMGSELIGSGFFSDIKSKGRTLANNVRPALLNEFNRYAPIVKGEVSKRIPGLVNGAVKGLTKSKKYAGIASNLSHELANDYIGPSGSGFFDIVKSVAKKAAPFVAKEAVSKLSGNKNYGNAAGDVTKAITGGNLNEADRGYGLGGSRLINSPNIQSVHVRMAKLRELKKLKHQGGSMLAL